MDLDAIQSALKDFATFGGNIGKALQDIPSLLAKVFGFFENFDELSSTPTPVRAAPPTPVRAAPPTPK